MNTVFKESQKFNQWWLWLILIIIGLIPIVGLYKQLVLKQLFGQNPISDLGLIILSLFIILVIGVFFLIELKTEISEDGISMKFKPFVEKKIRWDEIRDAEIVKYGFSRRGIRISLQYGTVYNIEGKNGLFVNLKSGDKLLIGTQEDKELSKVINHHLT